MNAKLFVKGDNGAGVKMTGRLSPWYGFYIAHPMLEDMSWHLKFRRRFRLSYPLFRELVRLVQLEEFFCYFDRWMGKSARNPVELLLLGSLRYLGRGWTFDDFARLRPG